MKITKIGPPKIVRDYIDGHIVSTLNRDEIEALIVDSQNKEVTKKLLYLLRYLDFVVVN